MNKVPKYLFLPKNIIRLVLLTALFALIFINIYKPFNADSWYNVSKFLFFVYSSLVVVTGVLVIAASRLVLYFYARHNEIGITGYILWVIMEVFFMAIFYAVYTVIFKHGTDFMDAFARSLLYSALVIIIPYSVIHLYLAYVSVDNKLQELRRNPASGTALSIYAFPDEHGDIQLSVTGSNLLYLESADNYVWVWYLNKNKPTRYILRNSLKNIENLFANSSLQRCHRSYMINLDAVSVMSRGQSGVTIDFGVDGTPIIPVSITYIEQITKWFKGYSTAK